MPAIAAVPTTKSASEEVIPVAVPSATEPEGPTQYSLILLYLEYFTLLRGPWGSPTMPPRSGRMDGGSQEGARPAPPDSPREARIDPGGGGWPRPARLEVLGKGRVGPDELHP